MWRAEAGCRSLLGARYRAGGSGVRHYDYKTAHPRAIPSDPAEQPVVLEMVRDAMGVQNVLGRMPVPQQRASAVVLAGNSGLPAGAVGQHVCLLGDVKRPGQLFRAPSGGTYSTQEEDVVKNWLLAENAANDTPIRTALSGIWEAYGMKDFGSNDTRTKQGVNFTNLTTSSSKTLAGLSSVAPSPYERLYAEAWVVGPALLRPKLGRRPDAYDEARFLSTSLVFVAGPNAGAEGSDSRSTTKRTFNAYLARNQRNFLDAVEWTYFAALHAVAMEGKRVALLPWISGQLYAGPHLRTYGVESDGSALYGVLRRVLYKECEFASRKRAPLGCAFDRVAVVFM